MAEIKIKKKAPIWPWIVGALILALLIYLFASNSDDVDDIKGDDTEQVVPDSVNDTVTYQGIDEVNDYKTFVSDPNMDLSHEYSSTALQKLIAATRATAKELNVEISSQLSDAEKKAEEITQDPNSLSHANKIKDAGQKITQALKTIQSEKFPELSSEYNEVETAVSNISVDTPTLEQKDAVKGFFTKASHLLTSIQNNHGKTR